jgi:hypothetical protein
MKGEYLEEYGKQLYPIYGICRSFKKALKGEPSLAMDLVQNDQTMLAIYSVFHGMCCSVAIFILTNGLEFIINN